MLPAFISVALVYLSMNVAPTPAPMRHKLDVPAVWTSVSRTDVTKSVSSAGPAIPVMTSPALDFGMEPKVVNDTCADASHEARIRSAAFILGLGLVVVLNCVAVQHDLALALRPAATIRSSIWDGINGGKEMGEGLAAALPFFRPATRSCKRPARLVAC